MLTASTMTTYEVLEVWDHVLTIDKTGIENTISIESATPVGSQCHRRLLTSRKYRIHTTNLHKGWQDGFVVHKIVGSRQMTNRLRYPVPWYGYEAKDDTL